MNNALSDLLIVTDGDLARLAPLGPDALLKGKLERAIIVSSEAVPPDLVIMDSRVLYTDETTGMRRRISIVLPHEADGADGRVSVLAPSARPCSACRWGKPSNGASQTGPAIACGSTM